MAGEVAYPDNYWGRTIYDEIADLKYTAKIEKALCDFEKEPLRAKRLYKWLLKQKPEEGLNESNSPEDLMKKYGPEKQREFLTKELRCDLAVVGGGMAGTCAAISAARAGLKVVLVQDRPVLGGNASSEVRLWVLGATAHMTNNNRWAREGGLHDEILVENTFRNPEGNPLIFDTVLLEKAVSEPNLTLLLNTAVIEAVKSSSDRIAGVKAFCSQNSTLYEIGAPLFCDASGDGVLGFLAGAAFRMGAEKREEFGEKFAPNEAYGELLGHSLYFYSKDTGKPVRFVPPSYALMDITEIPRFKSFNTQEYGCRLWWIEYGGRLDTVHETERIKWELWKVVYGVWNHIKNSGEFPDAANLTLEWVGQIPGKRESRRFEGPLILTQQDIVEQRRHPDAVAYGGWSIDLHPADGVYSAQEGCNQWHSRGLYQIPYRCLYSRNIKNLFLGGRTLSASHVAFGSTRVMGTLAYCGQAVAMAAVQCKKHGVDPAEAGQGEILSELQRGLQRRGQHIPGFALKDPEDLAQKATISSSSRLKLAELPADGPWQILDVPWAQMLPVAKGPAPKLMFTVKADSETELELQLRSSDRPDNHTPDKILATKKVKLRAGEQDVGADFAHAVADSRYLFYHLMPNPQVAVRLSTMRVTGLLSMSTTWGQHPEEDIGVESFDFYSPLRRPAGQNLACKIEPAIDLFGPENLLNGLARPGSGPNAWLASMEDKAPKASLAWEEAVQIGQVDLGFDTDFDHPMESVLMTQPENVMPFCVRHYRLWDGAGRLLKEVQDNHQTRNSHVFDPPISTRGLVLELVASQADVPKGLFELRCYAKPY